MSLPDHETVRAIRLELERICKDFTVRVESLGFIRTKKLLWTRRREWTVDVIAFHRSGSTYGAPINSKVEIRVHFAIRVLNDSFPAVEFNGPFSDAGHVREGRYHLSFNAKSGHMYERCLNDLVRFGIEVGEPWFLRFSDLQKLVSAKDTPLNLASAALLMSAMEGRVQADDVAISLKLLGIGS